MSSRCLMVLAVAMAMFFGAAGRSARACDFAPALIAVHQGSLSIQITAPPSVGAGTDLCVTVSTVAGDGVTVVVELNGVELPSSVRAGHEPGTWTVCFPVPAGAGGSVITITAISPRGSVATTTVTIT